MNVWAGDGCYWEIYSHIWIGVQTIDSVCPMYTLFGEPKSNNPVWYKVPEQWRSHLYVSYALWGRGAYVPKLFGQKNGLREYQGHEHNLGFFPATASAWMVCRFDFGNPILLSFHNILPIVATMTVVLAVNLLVTHTIDTGENCVLFCSP